MSNSLKIVCPATHQADPQSIGLSDFKCMCCPVGRSGHRIIVSEDSLYALGGFNPNPGQGTGYDYIPVEQDDRGLPLFRELWKFNISSRQWQMVDNYNSVPPTIASHTFVKAGRWLFLFGGTGLPFGETKTNSIYLFDVLSTKSNCGAVDNQFDVRNNEVIRHPGNRWHLMSVEGDVPEERYGHTMTMRFPDVYVVGGTSGYIYNAEVYHLDLRTAVGKWTKLSSDSDPKQPVGRYRHETALKGQTLYVFGGGTDRAAFSLVRIPTFNIATREWGKVTSLPDPQYGHPLPRKCHSCSQSGNDVLLVGGVSGTTERNEIKIFDDIWRFSLLDATWSKYSTTPSAPLYFHSADICEKSGCLWIFGGVTIKDNVETRTNRTMCLRVKAGRLLELAWAVVCDCLCNKWSKLDLDELGIPSFLQARLQP